MVSMAPVFLLATLSFVAPVRVAEDPDPETLKALAARCGSEVDWVTSWEEAARRARREHKPVLVLVRSILGFDLPDSSMLGPFMDLDVVTLVQNRYVALRFAKGMDAPFVRQDSYGMGPSTFGTSILVATEDGEIVGDTFTLEVSSLLDFLVEQLAAYPNGPAPKGLSKADQARWHLDRGDHAEVEALLEDAETARELQLRAALRYRQRRGEEALQDVARARKLGGEGFVANVALLEARTLARFDRIPEALQVLERIPPQHPDAAAALLDRASMLLARAELAEAIEVSKAVVRSHPESRSAWSAAASLLLVPLLEQTSAKGSSLAWPHPEVLATLERHAPEVLPAREVDRAEQTALGFLLRAQREDGSWISASEVMGAVDHRLNALVVGTTALCGRGVLSHAHEPAAEDAAAAALAFLRSARDRAAEVGLPFSVMDYTVWSKPCQLLFLADAIDAGIADPDEWEPTMEALVAELQGKQKSGGGWSYYQGMEVGNLDPQLDVSFSFVTAFVLLGLHAADEVGIEVPDEMLTAALGCLERMRNDDGSFEYSLFHANENAPRTPLPAGSAGRGPLCALTLYLWERADLAEVRGALDRFLEHRHSYAREQGKTLMHCGPQGQGSHYLMFDYAFAAAACDELVGNARYTRAVLELILGARSAAGSYVDNPLIGPHYGTAMALWAFGRLREET